MKEKWERGQKKQLAELAGYSQQYLSGILNRWFKATAVSARKLEAASRKMGLHIHRYDFMESDITENPYFAPKHGNDCPKDVRDKANAQLIIPQDIDSVKIF